MTQAQVVMPDPQYGIFRILRPQSAYETFYQGVPANVLNPIYFFPNGDQLDGLAGQPGYSTRLIRGLPVPQGSNVILWIPNVPYAESPTVQRSYIWFLIWRVRNVATFRQDRTSPFHLALTRGVTDTTAAPVGGPRDIIPAAYETVVINQPEAVTPGFPESLRAVQHGRAEDMTMSAILLEGPRITPAGVRGVIQQGVQDPGVIGTLATVPRFLIMSTRAKGDELIVGLYRNPVPANWDFGVAAADRQLFDFFEAGQNIGIYVSVGTP
jgi:hypothetical protein